jgi:hypothetical protein
MWPFGSKQGGQDRMNGPVAPVHHQEIHPTASEISYRRRHLFGINGLSVQYPAVPGKDPLYRLQPFSVPTAQWIADDPDTGPRDGGKPFGIICVQTPRMVESSGVNRILHNPITHGLRSCFVKMRTTGDPSFMPLSISINQDRQKRAASPISAKLFCKHSRVAFMPLGCF